MLTRYKLNILCTYLYDVTILISFLIGCGLDWKDTSHENVTLSNTMIPMHITRFNIHWMHLAHSVYLWVLYDRKNKQWLFPSTPLTTWFFWWGQVVFFGARTEQHWRWPKKITTGPIICIAQGVTTLMAMKHCFIIFQLTFFVYEVENHLTWHGYLL